MTNLLRGVLVDTINNKIETRKLFTDEDTFLHEYYKILNCDTIDIISRKIGNNYYDIICDDEGLLKDMLMPSMIILDGNGKIVQFLVGNIFIVKHDGNGNEKSLTNAEIDEIMSNIYTIICKYDSKIHKVIGATL